MLGFQSILFNLWMNDHVHVHKSTYVLWLEFETLLNLINYELLHDMNIFPIPLNILDIIVHKVVDSFVCVPVV